MNAHAKAWVAALRSDRFKQGERRLTTITPDGEFDCCLGVACKLYIEDGNELSTTTAHVVGDDDGVRKVLYGRHGEGSVLPDEVRKWLGVVTYEGIYQRPDSWVTNKLSEKNDSGTPFLAIADIIESEPVGLFA